MFWTLLVGGLCAFVYFVLIRPFTFWSRKGVIQQNIFTQWWQISWGLLQLKAVAETVEIMYKAFPNVRYSGMYQFFSPVLFLRDPDLIKQITVKDFDHFLDHNQFVPEENEPLWGKNLFSLKGDRWKDMRATLSPSFTSSKMRAMFRLMNECAEQFVRYFKKDNSQVATVDLKDAFTRYANDVIASTAFGITVDSLKDRENEFYMMGKQATNFRGFWKNLQFSIMFFSPKLARILGIRMFGEEVSTFFRNLVKGNIESREKNGIVRPDMIHLLMEARKGRLKHEDGANGIVDTGFAVLEESSIGKEVKRQKQQLTDDDVTAQALIFFFAGFENISTLMCFVAYELVFNLDIQRRLQEEIDDTLKECDGSLTYEALLKMKYLDMVLSETLRKWPGAIAADRLCVKPYTIQPVNDGEKPVKINKGELLWLPIFGIHRDPQFYPEPERFDPERFSDENKHNINPYTYLPFGSGPRNCIGNRFALLETKTILFHVLANFDIVAVDKTAIPLTLSRDQFALFAKDGFWFGLKSRKIKN